MRIFMQSEPVAEISGRARLCGRTARKGILEADIVRGKQLSRGHMRPLVFAQVGPASLVRTKLGGQQATGL